MISLRQLVPAVGLFLGAPGAALAQDATPSHVFQSVGAVEADLSRFLDANFFDPSHLPAAPAATPRRPRHVFREARRVLLDIGVLRQINGLAFTPPPAAPVREVAPTHVKALIDEISVQTAELRALYGYSNAPTMPDFVDGKTPGDVFARLAALPPMIEALGAPRPTPNAVRRVAEALLTDIGHLGAALGRPAPGPVASRASAKTPGDVYARVTSLQNELVRLVARRPALAISGGVLVSPPAGDAAITPAQVLSAVNSVIADIGALKQRAGADQPSTLGPVRAGQTPSDVFDYIDAALRYARTL